MVARNMSELKAMLTKRLRDAMQSASEGVLEDLQDETSGFYAGTTPKVYERTYALQETPKVSAVQINGLSAEFDAYLDQTHRYTTGDAPTMDKVLKLANSGIPWTTRNGKKARQTIGNKGFWERAEKKAKKDFERTLKQFFK